LYRAHAWAWVVGLLGVSEKSFLENFMKYRIFKYEAGLTIKKYEAIISTIIHPIPIFTSIRGAFSLHLSIRKGTFKKKARSELKSGPIDQLWDFRFFIDLRKVGFEPTRSVEHRDAYD